MVAAYGLFGLSAGIAASVIAVFLGANLFICIVSYFAGSTVAVVLLALNRLLKSD